jgi:arylsulfatase A-like enzyme
MKSIVLVYGAFCYDYTIKTFTYFLANNLPTLEIKQQTRTIDFMPTVLDFLEIPLDHNSASLDGISLTPLINGEETDEQIAFTETANPLESKKPPKEPNTKSVRTSKWKLIYNEYNNTKELYNLEKDPAETNNLINSGLEIEEFLWNEFLRINNSM